MRDESFTYHTFHPDHLGSTSYVTGADGNVAQHVEYIPYGEVFVEERSGTVGTAYLFNAKELDEETGMYYYGARYLDPASAMWISVDPMWEKFAGMSAYNYCAGNPVKMVDPDGKELRISGDLSNLALSQLQKKVGKGFVLSMDKNGVVSGTYTDKRIKRYQQKYIDKLNTIMENKNVRVNLKTTNKHKTSSGKLLLGGAFMGNKVHDDKAVAYQEINPEVLGAVDEAFGSSGGMIFHEVTEAYKGALISIAEGTSAPEATLENIGSENSVCYRAHSSDNGFTTPQVAYLFFERYDKDDKFLETGKGEASYIKIFGRKDLDYGGFKNIEIRKITLEDLK